jgi:hypothetical protein
MSRRHTHHTLHRRRQVARIPRAGRDPITGADDALAVISLAMDHPLTHETIAFGLDGDRCGNVITVVSCTESPDAVIDVVEVLCRSMEMQPRGTGLVVASIRPWAATLPGDVDRWLEASAVAESFGIELVEWFVIGPPGAECPRELIGEPERW